MKQIYLLVRSVQHFPVAMWDKLISGEVTDYVKHRCPFKGMKRLNRNFPRSQASGTRVADNYLLKYANICRRWIQACSRMQTFDSCDHVFFYMCALFRNVCLHARILTWARMRHRIFLRMYDRGTHVNVCSWPCKRSWHPESFARLCEHLPCVYVQHTRTKLKENAASWLRWGLRLICPTIWLCRCRAERT